MVSINRMVRIDDSNDETKCWLDFPEEVQTVEQHARDRDWEQEIAIQLMARIRCRASGVKSAKPENLRWNSKGEYWEIEVREKNTKGGEKTIRDAWIPERVKENLDRYRNVELILTNPAFLTPQERSEGGSET